MLGRRSREYLAKVITGDLYAEFSGYAGHYLLNSANAGQMPAEFSKCWAEEVKKYLTEKRELVMWVPYD